MAPSSAPEGRNRKPPTGEAFPVQSPPEPLEVVFKAETFRRLIAWTFGPLIVVIVGVISAALYFYHHTNVHLEDPTIHLTRGERGKLETKIEAVKARDKLEKDIKNHFDLKTGQIKLENAKQINKIGNQLRSEQKIHYRRLLSEIKKGN